MNHESPLKKIFNESTNVSFSSAETLSSTQEIDLGSGFQSSSSLNTNCDDILLKNNEILHEIHTTFSNVRIRSLLFHVERAMLFGTFGVNLKSLGLSIGIANGNYWNFVFAIFTIFSFPICCFAIRHDFANKLYISLNVLFLMFSVLLLTRNLTIMASLLKRRVFLIHKKELLLILESLIIIGLILGMILNLINAFKIRKIISRLMAKHIDSCLGHRILVNLNRKKLFKKNTVSKQDAIHNYNCVLSIPHIQGG